MEETKSLLEKITTSQFGIEFIKVLTPLTVKHMQYYRENKGVNYDDIGNEKEKKLKNISKLFGLLQTSVSDLELVLVFLRLNDRKSILKMYPLLESQEQYFRYHLENYIIRIITITDILGKLGNSVFDTELSEDKCNGYSFKEKIKQTDAKASEIIEILLLKTKGIKEIRHEKLHKGKSELGYFESIVFYDETSKIMGMEESPILDEITDEKINKEIDSIEIEINSILKIAIEFLNHITIKFIEISNR